MSRKIRYVPLVALALVFAACGERSSGITAPEEVRAPRMDDSGGLGVGGSATGTPPSPSPDTDPTVQTVQNDSIEGGGLGVGGS